MAIKIGLVGYGVGGRLFHAPYISASSECELVGIVARSSLRKQEATADFPDVPIFESLTSLIAAGVDAVVITTPPATRDELVREAVLAGVHVVADKPFAPSAQAGQELVDLASEHNVLLNVFHNRRNDADIVTAKNVIDSGELGALRSLDLRCDQNDPSTLEAGPTGGLLRDLGSHVVDQALFLCGPAQRVHALMDMVTLPEGVTDSAFAITIEHEGGIRSHVSCSKIDYLESRELRLHGSDGSYVSDYRDVQVDAIRAGKVPADDRSTWGYEEPTRWGRLTTATGERSVPSEQGDYTFYYDSFALAVQSGGEGPVPAQQGVTVLAVLDAARQSAREGVVIEIENLPQNI